VLVKDTAWASSGPGKFRMPYLPGKTSCCGQTEKKFWRSTQICEEKKRDHKKIRRMNLSVSSAQTRYSLPTDGHYSDGLVSRPGRPIRVENVPQLHKGYWHVEKSCKSIVINRYDQYQCQHNYFYQTIEAIFLIRELYVST
jgi:hypothetical protein